MGVLAGAAALVAAGLTGQASAATGTVSSTPTATTPYLVNTGTTPVTKLIRQCGTRMYAVGTFTKVGQPGHSAVFRNNIFSFDQATGAISSWDPNVNGLVNTITFDPTCSSAYIGGVFTTVGGVAAKNIAKISTSTGALDTVFGHSAPAKVFTLAYTGGHVLAGGTFKSINGKPANFLTSLSATTGKPDGYLNLAISGTYPRDSTKIYKFSNIVGNRVLVNGVFTSVGGQGRRQVFMLDLGSTSATLDAWYSPRLDEACQSQTEQFYAKGATISPDGQSVYIASTGLKGATLCDSVAKFSAGSSSNQQPVWTNKTGGDSLYTVIADATGNVYISGHERWANNPNGLNQCVTTCVPRQGIGDIDATTGLATPWNPGRSRGHGAEDIYLDAQGHLWVSSDAPAGSTCGGKFHPGICSFA